jgi:hypothetical protein
VANVPTVLLDQLAAARAAGATFAQAWPAALDVTLASSAPLERDDWSVALDETSESWRTAFERQAAPRRERALAIVAVDPDRVAAVEPDQVPIGDRECAHCGGEIPDARGRRGAPARYCTPRCKRDAAYVRERSGPALDRVA